MKILYNSRNYKYCKFVQIKSPCELEHCRDESISAPERYNWREFLVGQLGCEQGAALMKHKCLMVFGLQNYSAFPATQSCLNS